MRPAWLSRAAAGAAILAMLALAGCTPGQVDGRPAPSLRPSPPALELAESPEPLDASSVAGLDGQRLRNDEVGIQARYARVFGQDALNDRIEGIVRDAIATRAADSGVSYQPAAFERGTGLGDRACVKGSTLLPAADLLAEPDLGPAAGEGTAVACDIVAATGSYVGERVRVVGSDGTDTAVLLYADVATGEVVRAAELWKEEAGIRLWDDVIQTLNEDAGGSSPASIADPTAEEEALLQAALETTLVAPDGSLVLSIGAGLTAPELTADGVDASAAPVTVAVPPGSVEDLATPFGVGMSEAAAASLPFGAPEAIPVGFDRVDCTLVPCIALTFDDGPSPLTPQLLDTLRDARAAATFYLLGRNAEKRPETIRRTVAEGHVIGDHTWNHPHLRELDPADLEREIGSTRDLLEEITGEPVTTFRPPYGEYDDQVLATAGLPAILWSITTRDWSGPPTEELLAKGVDEPQPGSIVLFHDTQQQTVDLAPQIIAGLQDRGFTAVTITQLFGGTLPSDGAWRSGP